MKALISLLDDREKKSLAWLAALLGVALAALIVLAFGARRWADRRAGDLENLRRLSRTAEKDRAAQRAEFDLWQEAGKDLTLLRKERFYTESAGANALRLDLQSIFSRLGVESPGVKFDYQELEKEKARKVSVTFNFSGPYSLLKRLLFEVEKQSRFLFVERILFQSIDGQSGNLLLRVTLAAYHAT